MGYTLRRLAAFLRRDRLDSQVREEIELHIELRRQALEDEGMAPADAAREARRQFGNVTGVRERTRDEWGGSTIDALIQDVRYGLRLIRKAPGFTFVAIASLAVGIGASTVIFSFANGVLFRPLPAASPEELVQLFTSNSSGRRHGGSSYADYEDFRKLPVFDGLLAWTRAGATLSGHERPDLVQGHLVSGNYFDVLGLRAYRGRFFQPEESRAGSEPVVVLSHDGWRRHFGADDAIVGRAIELNGRPFTVIGVAPPKFTGVHFEFPADFFAPVTMHEVITPGETLLRSRGARSFRLLGRLKDGVSISQADAALRVLAADLLRQDPAAWTEKSGRGRFVTIKPEIDARFIEETPGGIAAIVAGVLAAVFALLAVACVNVATVLLARATTRRKEIAVRLAMGASRRRVVRQMLTECALLALAGGGLGVLLAQWAAALVLRFRPAEMPAFDLTLDYRILIFSLAASALTVLLFGLAPALQTTRPDLQSELKDAMRPVRVRGFRFNLRSGLVVVQVALSLALLIGGALMLRSAQAGRTMDPGFRVRDVVSIDIDLSTIPNRGGAHARYYDEAVRAASSLPGAERAALAMLVPMDGSNSQNELRIGQGASAFRALPDVNIVGPGYFAMLDIPVLRGREFTAGDSAAAPAVAVVNERMAREAWNGDALGKTFVNTATNTVVQVVGVVRDLRHRSFGEEPLAMVYFNAAQRTHLRMTLHVRTAVPPAVFGPALQRSIRDVNRSAALPRVETMAEFFERMMIVQRLGASAAMGTALLELMLAVMALYGVIAFAATQRRREIGVRMALGATSRSIVALIMREGLVLTGVGIMLGVGVAIAVGVGLGSLLIGVGPGDPVSYVTASLLLLGVAAAASYVPARRALRIDPAAALRSE
jgi:predicted permease